MTEIVLDDASEIQVGLGISNWQKLERLGRTNEQHRINGRRWKYCAPTEDGGETLRPKAKGRATLAEGTTKGATATKEEGQKGIVKSKAKEADRSSCIKGCSGGATEASVDTTDAGTWGDPP